MNESAPLFEPVVNNPEFPELEEKILAFWQKHNIFQRSIDARTEQEYVFYDGPPFATGLPHYGHLLAGTIKDIIPRYWTMQGFKVNRRFGWDCHGLPIENEAAKDLKESHGLNLSGRYEIENYGIDKFNEYCRSIVLKYTAEWEKTVTRMGRWVDFDNNYRTMDKDFMESVWWVFKQLWDKGLVYQGFRVMPYSWKLSTPLSNFEASENYQNVQDPAITIRFRVSESEWGQFSILAWTTTPWTLPSNLALAIHNDLEYNFIEVGDEVVVVAAARQEAYPELAGGRVVRSVSGAQLTGLSYTPLFDYFKSIAPKAFHVYHSDHVTTSDGTGVVHIAPAFGEDDYKLGQSEEIGLADPVDAEGKFTDLVHDFAGRNVKEADKDIIRRLKENGLLFKQDTLQHNYPFCWRSNTPLIYKAISTWFIKVEPFREAMTANNNQIAWVPETVGKNRFGNWLQSALDWNISRNRYWGTPIPIWESEDGEQVCIGSVQELEEFTGVKTDDLHSHIIDKLEFKKNGKVYKRIPEVFDCWFESGSMPYAQNHYPFENKDYVEDHFPADFIAEGLDQTRGWFYTLTILSTILFDKPAFKNVVVNGLILAEDGSKMSKSKKNYPDPNYIIDKYGADVLRAYLINSPVVKAEPLKFSEGDLSGVYRKIVLPLWNAYSFFITYARIDGYKPEQTLTDSTNYLDRWVLSKLQSLIKDITDHMEGNYLYKVVPRLEEFTELLTNWYIRRSRRRFWKTDESQDKQAAYNTLYFVLTEYITVLAPFLPFLSEIIFQNLTRTKSTEDSVHLVDYPKPLDSLINQQIEEEMALALEVVELGRTLRAKYDRKIRQPLASVTIVTDASLHTALTNLEPIILDELNVKKAVFSQNESDFVTYSLKPNFKVLGKKVGSKVKEIAAECANNLSSEQINSFVQQGTIEVLGEKLTAEDLIVEKQEREGLATLASHRLNIALDTNITPELKAEGVAREAVNRIQNQRKSSEFNVEDRILVEVQATPDLKKAITQHVDYIQDETLSDKLTFTDAPDGESVKEWDIDGQMLTIGLSRC